jgi:PAS domain S-box-containing protein
MFRKKQKKKGVEDAEGKRLRDILDSMIDGVTILDMNGKIIEVNRSTLLQHGYTTKEEILGKTPAEVFIDKKDIPKFVNTVEKILTGEQVLAEEYQARRKDGTLFTASVNVSLLKDIQGNPKAIIAVHRDITELRESQKKAEEASARSASIIEAIPDSVCISSFNRDIIAVNKTMEELFEIPREKLLSMNTFDLATEEDIAKTSGAVQELVRTGKPQSVEVTGSLGKAKGRPYWMNMALLKDEKGDPISIITVTRDLTEHKQAKEALQKAHDELEKKVGERTEELQEKLNELERFRKATIDREFRIKELREEVERLKEEKGNK